MRNILLFISILFTAAFPAIASESFHYSPSNKLVATGQAYATIVSPISVRSIKDIAFGLAENNNTRQVKLNTTSGKVQIKGPQGHFVSVSIPEVNIYDNDNNSFKFNPHLHTKNQTLALNTHNGEAVLNINGTLKFTNNQLKNVTKKGFYVVQTSY